jgi:GMP synthase (glutamine-hydrolysing)
LKKLDFILILDFGSQFTQLIARRLRELKVYCEIQPFNIDIEKFLLERSDNYEFRGLILSGGPSSVLSKDSPAVDKRVLDRIIAAKIPVLGICYGLQLLCSIYGGKLHRSKQRQYGNTSIKISKKGKLFKDVPSSLIVWMSHGDSIDRLPEKFSVTSKSSTDVISSFEEVSGLVYGLQFHPEVEHTQLGRAILSNFVFGICGVKNLFMPSSFIDRKVEEIRNTAGGQ